MATVKKTRKPRAKAAAENPPLIPEAEADVNREAGAGAETEAAASNGAEARERFIIEKPLGRGGVCEVYEALDLMRAGLDDVQPRVALKKLRPEFRDQSAARLALVREFAKTRSLKHPGVIQVYDLHQHGGDLCLSMELIEAPTLRERLRRGPELQAADAVRTARELFQALAHIHDRGLAHADLKPGNIFLKAGHPIIFDFNVAAALPRPGQAALNPVQALVESKNFPAGTPVYSAPERLAGAPPGPENDVFSAAVTVYEMLSGRHPFGRRSSADAAGEGLAPRRPGLLDRRLWRYLEAALSFEPRQRPTAEELARVYAAGEGFRVSRRAALLRDDLRHLAADMYKTAAEKIKKFSNKREVKNGSA